MLHYELATLSIHMGKASAVSEAVAQFCQEPNALGKLVGVWATDIGALNQVIVLREFNDANEAAQERERTLHSNNPFLAQQWIETFTLDSFRPFPYLPAVQTGEFGAIYEIRTYDIKPDRLEDIFRVWQEALPGRTQLSHMTTALYSTSGTPRIVSIWPYASLNERSQVRADAVAQKVWPPVGGPACLRNQMQSVIGLPLPASLLK